MKIGRGALALAICAIAYSSSAFAFSAIGIKAAMLNCLNKELSSSDRIAACNEVIHTNELIGQSRARIITSRGNAYFAAAQPDKALDDYNKAIELDPRLAEAVTNRAVILVRQGKCGQAAPDLGVMLKADEHSWRGLYARSLCEAKNGDQAKAQLDLSAANAVNPNAADDFAPVEIAPWFQ